MTEAQARVGGAARRGFSGPRGLGVVMMAAALGFAWVGGLRVPGVLVGGFGRRALRNGAVWSAAMAFGPGFGLAASRCSLPLSWPCGASGPMPEFALLAVALGAAGDGRADGRASIACRSGAGVVYAGVLAAGATALRASPQYGFAAILWLFGVVWGTDVMAYFGGRLIGGPKLWPRVSPGKTWSGAIVGVVLGAVIGAVVARSSRLAPSI